MLACASTSQAECHSITNVGTLVGATQLEVRDMNNAGEIVGWTMSNNTYQGFLYANGVLLSLGSLGGQGCMAQGINDAGQVVGSAATAAGDEHAFLYYAGQMIDIGTLGGNQSRAVAINSSGLVTGFSGAADGSCHLFTWQNGVRTDAGRLGLTDCEVSDINGGGTVIGLNQLLTAQLLAFSWTAASGFQMLGTFGGVEGYPYRINDSGHMAGAIHTGQYILAMPIYHAFLYRNGGTTDLGTLGGASSGANGINNSGTVVGWSQVTNGQHAFIYDSVNGLRDLNTLVSSTSGWTLESAVAVNDAGQIAGTGWLNGQKRVFLLTPSQTDADSDGLVDACEADESPSGGADACGTGVPTALVAGVGGFSFLRRRNR